MVAGLQRTTRAASLLLAFWLTCGFTFDNRYVSPRNPERELRRSTRYLILHTTEAPAASSLNKLSDRGEAHFGVDTEGRVYRIVDQRRVAYHCGRSMWNGRSNIDDDSIGIEVVGYHNRELTPAQYVSLAALIGELQNAYKIPDERVLTHSMVAYGAPNRWQKSSHRGRKRCGMLFARWSVRKRLSLTAQPKFDPDVCAGRLIVADPYLSRVLYGDSREQDKAAAHFNRPDSNVIAANRSAWDIACDAYDNPETIYLFPDGTRKRGNEIRNWKGVPIGTRVLINDAETNPDENFKTLGVDGRAAADLAGDEVHSASTFYVLPGGKLLRGTQLTPQAAAALPHGTRVLTGYAMGGPISASLRAFDICGTRWRAKDTYFLYSHGLLKPGSEMKEKQIPTGAFVFYKN
jgi:hypothetical protein